MTNPTAGHTSATGMGSDAQGLRDGDGLTSPSLTNLYEGLHGNGIMRLGDGAKGDSLRNSVVANTPGFIQIGSSQGEVKVYGGYCVLDGVLYKFANGPGSHETFIVGTTGAGANHSGDLPSVPSSNADVFIVVYLVGRSTPEAHLMYEMGTPAAPTSGTPLLPNRFLSSPSISGNTDLNHQTTVLGVIRYSMTGGAANVTASLGSPVIHDRRAFLRKSPLYLTPMTKGAIGNVDAANALTNPDSFFASPEEGNLTGSTFGAIWQTHREDVAGAKHGIILAALPKNLDTTPVTGTYVLGPDRLETITTSGNITFTFDEANIWVVTTDAARTINPTGVFSAGHVVDIFHKAGAHNLHFDSTSGGHSSTPINVNIASGESARFVYDGSNWHQVIAAASSSPSSSGASGLVQLSNGAGGFTSDTTLSYDTAANELTVDGKLTVTGLIDPTGLELAPQASNPGGVAANTLWLDSGASNRLKQGTSNVIRASDSATELSDVTSVGSGAIITSAERTKLTNVATGATANDTDANLRDRTTHTGTQAASTIGSGTFADARIAQSNVTQHQAALSITESQISDLQTYLTAETDPVFTASAASSITNAGSGLVITTAERTSLTRAKARITLTSNQSYSSGTTKVAVDNVIFDTGSDWDSTNKRWVAPRDGYYSINAGVWFTIAPSSWQYLLIYVNGAYVLRHPSSMGLQTNLSGMVYITSGQYVELYVNTNSSSLTIGANDALTWLDITELV